MASGLSGWPSYGPSHLTYHDHRWLCGSSLMLNVPSDLLISPHEEHLKKEVLNLWVATTGKHPVITAVLLLSGVSVSKTIGKTCFPVVATHGLRIPALRHCLPLYQQPALWAPKVPFKPNCPS